MKTFFRTALALLVLLEGYFLFVLIPPVWLRPFFSYKDLGGTHPALDWEIEQAWPAIAPFYYPVVLFLLALNTLAVVALRKRLRRANAKG
jgi:hypothetical protein